jgi:signal peptidase I
MRRSPGANEPPEAAAERDAAAEAGERKGEAAAGESKWESFSANVKTIGGAILLAMFIRIVLFEAFEIEGPSMEPTLLNGDRVVVSKASYGLFLPFASEAAVSWGMPEVGSVVIVKSPADDIDIVKRVVGVPGDTIWVKDSVVYRNGRPVPTEVVGPCSYGNGDVLDDYRYNDCLWVRETVGERTFVTSRASDLDIGLSSRVTVPEGHVYVLGDHRDRSNDSRNPLIGAVPVGRVKGKALFVYWSSFRDPAEGWIGNLRNVRWSRIGDGID